MISPTLKLAVFLPIALVIVALASACGSSGPKTYTIEEASFEYPGGWSKGKVENEEAEANRQFSGLVGVTDDSFIYISKYILNIAVDKKVLTENLDALDEEIRGILESDGGVIEDGPDQGETATLPSLRYEGTTEKSGTEYGHIWVFVFNGKDQYFFNCQWDDKHEDEVQDACERALETFAIDK